jgi:hypothetical protein
MHFKPRQNLLTNSGLALVLVTAILAVTYLYISSESTFYSSDYAGYQNITQGIVADYWTSLAAAARAIVRSTAAEYNAIFTIPLIPFLLIFGESRLVYEIALAAVYLLPFTLVLGAIAVQLIPKQARVVFWSTVAMVLLMPPTWVPTLRGYPDTGAAFLLLLAIWVYLRDTTLNHRGQILLIGLLTALAMLFRRHFAYAGIGFFVAMALQTLAMSARRSAGQPRDFFQELLTRSRRVGLTAAAALLVLLVVGFPFVYRGLTTSYNALYAAYMGPPLTVLQWYAATYGWAALALAMLGLVMGMRSGVVNHEAGLFIAIFGGLSGLEWLFIVRQTGEQYTLHFTPMVALGLSALVGTVWFRLRGRLRVLALCGILLYMSANVAAGLTPVELVHDPTIRSLFAMKELPLMRGDRAEIARLVSYLREAAAHGEPIYVAASSAILTTSLLTTAERALYGWNDARLHMLYAPQIDSRDSLPLEMLLQAQYVVVAHPFQHHMGVEKQRVVKVVYDLFSDNMEMARDFARLPTTFMLDERTVISVYKRIRPTSLPIALRTLHFIESQLQMRPGGQLDWLLMSQSYPGSVRRHLGNTYQVTMDLKRHSASLPPTLLYLGALPEVMSITGRVTFLDKHCDNIILHLVKVDSQNEIIGMSEVTRLSKDVSTFNFKFHRQDATNLLLAVTSTNWQPVVNDCSLAIDALKLFVQ